MKLTELNPRWYRVHGREGRIGVVFDCPHCKAAGISPPEYLHVPFANPLDGAEPDKSAECRWQREGEMFETLTLSPSVDASHFGHWHGVIRAGEVT